MVGGGEKEHGDIINALYTYSSSKYCIEGKYKAFKREIHLQRNRNKKGRGSERAQRGRKREEKEAIAMTERCSVLRKDLNFRKEEIKDIKKKKFEPVSLGLMMYAGQCHSVLF